MIWAVIGTALIAGSLGFVGGVVWLFAISAEDDS